MLGLDDGSNLALRVWRVPLSAPIGYVLCAVALAVVLRATAAGNTRRLFLIFLVRVGSVGIFVDVGITMFLTSASILTKNE